MIATTNPLTGTQTATTQYGYDDVGNRTVITDVLTHVTRYTYDALNRQLAVTDPLSHTTSYGYDAVGNRTVITDANNHVTLYGYDSLNRTIAITDALTQVTRYQYDAVGNRTVITDARSNATQYGYDALNRVTAITIPITGTQVATTRYGYDQVGNRTVITDANSNVTRYGYDALNRTTVITDALTHTTQYGYDRVGNQTFITDSVPNTTRYDYDALNRVITITNPTGKTELVSYDAVGNRLTTTDELNQSTQYVYDKAQRVVAVTNPLTQTTNYGYDKVGNTLAITDASGITTTFGYNNANQVVNKTTSMGMTQYAYDNVGNVLTTTQPANTKQVLQYDNANRVTQENDLDASATSIVTYTFAYDPNGNKTSETEIRPGQSNRVTGFTYNKANWQTTVTDPFTNTTTYNYDAVGNQTGVTDPSGYATSVTYTANNLPLVTTLATGGASAPSKNAPRAPRSVIATTTNTYDARGYLQGWTTADSPNNLTLTTTLQYNANGYLAEDDNSHQGSNKSDALTSGVNYTDNQLAQNIVVNGSVNITMQYDNAGRLICSQTSNAWPGLYYDYDASGRRSHRYVWDNACQPGGGVSTYIYNGNRLIEEDSYNYVRTLSYDADGNVVQMVKIAAGTTYTLTYTWEPGTHRLVGVRRNDPIRGEFTGTLDYDQQGRIRQFCQGTSCQNFFYVGDSDWISYITNESGIVLHRYQYANGRPVRVQDTSATYYYRYNWHGDIVGAVDTSGNGGTWTTYGAWGESYSTFLTDRYYAWNGGWGYLRFPGWFNFDLNDALDTGLYYVHGRWYNQDTGMWLSPNDKGDYLYGGDAQDAVNYGWITSLAAPGVGGGMPPTLLQGIVAHGVIQSWCFVTFLLDCRTNQWTGRGFADIVLWSKREVYEIKPNTLYGIQTGPTQLLSYIDEMTSLYGGSWFRGTTWKPYGFFVLPDGTVLNVITHYDTYPGMIFYYWSQSIPVYLPGRATQRIPVLIPILKPASVPIMPDVPVVPDAVPIPVTP